MKVIGKWPVKAAPFSAVAAFAVVASGAGAALAQPTGQPVEGARPNILFCITDDQSWADTSIHGDPAVKTPVFGRIARNGVLFSHSFCSSPSCTPSGAAILTAQDLVRLEEGANLLGPLPSKFKVYPDILGKAGYVVGLNRKGWGYGSSCVAALVWFCWRSHRLAAC